MSDPKGFASLSPRLLARKGGAKPAMRPQVQPLTDFPPATPDLIAEDLGWNDMGETAPEAPSGGSGGAEVVPITGKEAGSPARPDVVIRREALSREVAGGSDQPDPAAAAKSRRVAFTLRIDAERHRRLRLACLATNRSAQRLLTEALDNLLAELPESRPLAATARKRS